MEVWTQRVPSGVTYFARDLSRSYLHEPQKNEIYFLNVYKDILGALRWSARSGQKSNTFEMILVLVTKTISNWRRGPWDISCIISTYEILLATATSMPEKLMFSVYQI